LHPSNHKKVQKAKKSSKGVRLHLSQNEVAGSGFLDWIKDVGNKIADAGNWVKHNVIDSYFYQKNIRPIAHDIVASTVKPVVSSYTGPLSGVANQGIDAIGNSTGAFGLKHHKKRKGKKVAHETKSHAVEEFVVKSALAPRPGGNAGFTAFKQPETGDGVNHIHVHHYHHHGMKGGSFRLS
jgi:hypothetical protein